MFKHTQINIVCFLALSFLHAEIDVVIPSIHKDKITLDLCIEGIKNNCKDVRRVIVVSSTRLTDKAEWFDEKDYPFSKADVAREIFQDEFQAKKYLSHPKCRIGWIYQQLLKFYAPFVIPEISSNVLILDSDVIFLKEVRFLEENRSLFATALEYTAPYFEHANRFVPGLKRLYPEYSGICHHMLFQKELLEDLFQTVETAHQIPLWKAFCHSISRKQIFGEAASEYEIYFNYVFTYHGDKVSLRPLKWLNVSDLNINDWKAKDYDYIAYHEWCRPHLKKKKTVYKHMAHFLRDIYKVFI